MKRIAFCLVLTAGLGVVGCGVDAADIPPSSGEPPLGAVHAIGDYADVEFPLDEFRTTPEESLTLNRADDLAVQNCLARFGIEYPVPDRTIVPHVDRPIGVISSTDAATFGYKSPFAADVAAVDNANASQKPLSNEARGVLAGEGKSTVNGVPVPAGGCAGEASRALADRDPKRENLVIGLAADSYAMAEADSRVQAVFTRWSQCMSAAGYDYADPWAANNDPTFGVEAPPVDEIATATTDVACRAKEEVNDIWVAAIKAYQEQLVTEHQNVLNQRRDEIEIQLSAANDLLGK